MLQSEQHKMTPSQNDDEKDQNYDNEAKGLAVKEWLLSSGLSLVSCCKLISGGYDTMALFDACTQDDIDDIGKEFNFSKAEHLKLRAAVNKLLEKQTNELKVIDSEESDAMNKIQRKIDKFIDSMDNISTIDTQLTKQHKLCEKQINETFEKIERRMQKRKNSLLQKLSKMVKIKQKILSIQSKEMNKNLNKANKLKKECNILLSENETNRKCLILNKQSQVNALELSNNGKPKASACLIFDYNADYKHLLHTISQFGEITNGKKETMDKHKDVQRIKKSKHEKNRVQSKDYWDESAIGDHIKVCKQSVLCNEMQSYCYRSCFGQHVVDKGTHHWTLRIKQYHQGYCAWNMLIGVMKIDCNDKPIYNYDKQTKAYHRNSHFTANDHGYGFVGNLGQLTTGHGVDRSYGCPFRQVGDVIDVFLDLDKRTLAFRINNIGYGIAYDDLKETRYCLAVTFCGNKNELEMVKYDNKIYKD